MSRGVTATFEVNVIPTLIIGDVNGDGKVNVKDATYVQRAVALIIKLSDIQNVIADVNKDNSVNIKGSTNIQKYCTRFEVANVGEYVPLPLSLNK